MFDEWFPKLMCLIENDKLNSSKFTTPTVENSFLKKPCRVFLALVSYKIIF